MTSRGEKIWKNNEERKYTDAKSEDEQMLTKSVHNYTFTYSEGRKYTTKEQTKKSETVSESRRIEQPEDRDNG